MFYKHTKEGKVVILIVYIDDIIITGDDHVEILKLKEKLAAEFEIKDLGLLKYLEWSLQDPRKGFLLIKKNVSLIH